MEEKNAVVFTTFKSKTGFIINATQRADTLDDAWLKLGKFIGSVKGEPYEKSFNKFPPKKPIEYVEDRQCPTCGSKLIHAETKDGKKFIKCETNKWNAMLKKPEGCTFTEWPHDPKREFENQ